MRKLILGLCAAALLGGCTAAKNLYHTETAKDWCRREVETANMPSVRETASARAERLSRIQVEYDQCMTEKLSVLE